MPNKTVYIPDEFVADWEALGNKSAWVVEKLEAERENRGIGPDMTEIIEGKKYSTKVSTLLAHDRFWDGHNWERDGRNTYLYKTPKGKYFVVKTTCWVKEHDSLIPISKSEAMEIFEGLREKMVSYMRAFNVEPEEA